MRWWISRNRKKVSQISSLPESSEDTVTHCNMLVKYMHLHIKEQHINIIHNQEYDITYHIVILN